MKILDIYTDGSHLKHGSGRLGIGGVLVDLTQQRPLGKKISEFGLELIPDHLRSEFGPGAETCSNPTAELTAVLVSLRQFSDYIKTADVITVHADYIGVREWMTGKWKTKEPYIARIKEEILLEIDRQGLTGKVQYAWVKGHQHYLASDPDIHWNWYVDELAKNEKQL
jgi:ribonuclease HI